MDTSWLRRLAQQALAEEKLTWSVSTIMLPFAPTATREGEWIVYFVTVGVPPVVKVRLVLGAAESDGVVLAQIIEQLRELKSSTS